MPIGLERLGTSLDKMIKDSEGMGDREIRRLLHTKQSKIKLGSGYPRKGSGRDGDIQVLNTPKGIMMYTRFNGRWYGFSPTFIEDSEI